MNSSSNNGLIVSLGVNVVLPYVVYQYLSGQGFSAVIALSAAALFPIVGLVVSGIRTRHIDGIGLVVLVTLLLSVATALVSNSGRLALVEGSLVTVLFGIVCFGSILFGRPLLFYLSREFDAGTDPARLAKWNSHRNHPTFTRAINIVTAVWGVALIISGAIQLGLILLLSVGSGFVVTTVFPIVIVAGLVFWTQRYLASKDVFGENEPASRAPETAG